MYALFTLFAGACQSAMGSLNRMLGVLTEGNISISYIYSFVIRDDNAPVMVFQTEYLEEAVQILKKHGIHVID